MIDFLIRLLKRRPYSPIIIDGATYMARDWTFQLGGKSPDENNKREGAWLCARVHTIFESDRDRALHDHPFDYLTFILKGGYWEITKQPTRKRSVLFSSSPLRYMTWYGPGSVLFRRAESAHRLIVGGQPAVTWFIIGPRRRQWGFHTENGGWVYWKDFDRQRNREAS